MNKKGKSILLLMILAGIIGATYTQAQESIPPQVVEKMLHLPIIDGVITEGEYGGIAAPFHPFSSPTTLQDDDVYLAHDGVSLYVAWEAKASIENAETFYLSTQIAPSRIKDVCMPEGSDIKKFEVNGTRTKYTDAVGAKSDSGQIIMAPDIQEDGEFKVGRDLGHVVVEIKIPLIGDPQNEDITMVSGVSYGIAFAFLTGAPSGYHGAGTGGVTAEYLLFTLESRADFPTFELFLVLATAVICIGVFGILITREWRMIPR